MNGDLAGWSAATVFAISAPRLLETEAENVCAYVGNVCEVRGQIQGKEQNPLPEA